MRTVESTALGGGGRLDATVSILTAAINAGGGTNSGAGQLSALAHGQAPVARYVVVWHASARGAHGGLQSRWTRHHDRAAAAACAERHRGFVIDLKQVSRASRSQRRPISYDRLGGSSRSKASPWRGRGRPVATAVGNGRSREAARQRLVVPLI